MIESRKIFEFLKNNGYSQKDIVTIVLLSAVMIYTIKWMNDDQEFEKEKNQA